MSTSVVLNEKEKGPPDLCGFWGVVYGKESVESPF